MTEKKKKTKQRNKQTHTIISKAVKFLISIKTNKKIVLCGLPYCLAIASSLPFGTLEIFSICSLDCVLLTHPKHIIILMLATRETLKVFSAYTWFNFSVIYSCHSYDMQYHGNSICYHCCCCWYWSFSLSYCFYKKAVVRGKLLAYLQYSIASQFRAD